jgi:hypothetical protein
LFSSAAAFFLGAKAKNKNPIQLYPGIPTDICMTIVREQGSTGWPWMVATPYNFYGVVRPWKAGRSPGQVTLP